MTGYPDNCNKFPPVHIAETDKLFQMCFKNIFRNNFRYSNVFFLDRCNDKIHHHIFFPIDLLDFFLNRCNEEIDHKFSSQ